MASARAFFDTPTAENIFVRAVKSGDIEKVVTHLRAGLNNSIVVRLTINKLSNICSL